MVKGRVIGSAWRAHARGFTLIELMVTLTLLAVLAGAALPLVQLQAQRSQEQILRENLREIRGALDAYRRASEDGKIEKKAGASNYPPNLAVLVQGVADQSTPDKKLIYFLRRIPRDPFFPDPQAPAEATWALRAYASPPEAPAPGDDVYDVYSYSTGIGLNGQPYRDW
jgi:general secretion pathway protein G